MTTARELASNLAVLLRREHAAMAEFIVALAEFDRERKWAELGHNSLFYFLKRELGLSDGAAFYRKTAAELIQRYPQIVEPLGDGRLCLSTLAEVAKVITPENCAETLPRFFNTSKRQAKEVAVDILPERAAPQRTIIRSATAAPRGSSGAPRDECPGLQFENPGAPTSSSGGEPSTNIGSAARPLAIENGPASADPKHATLAAGADAPSSSTSPEGDSSTARPRDEASAAGPDIGTALGHSAAPQRCRPPESYVEVVGKKASRLHVTVSTAFVDKLKAATEALSHSKPGAKIEDVLEAGLDLVLKRWETRRGLGQKPSSRRRPSSNPGYIPADVKRKVWERDQGRCQFPLESGGICGSTRRLEFDHAVPRARGGPSTVENVRLRCRFHNQVEAESTFGREFMSQFTAASSAVARVLRGRRAGAEQPARRRSVGSEEAPSAAAANDLGERGADVRPGPDRGRGPHRGRGPEERMPVGSGAVSETAAQRSAGANPSDGTIPDRARGALADAPPREPTRPDRKSTTTVRGLLPLFRKAVSAR